MSLWTSVQEFVRTLSNGPDMGQRVTRWMVVGRLRHLLMQSPPPISIAANVDCALAERIVMKALCVIHARSRVLHWRAQLTATPARYKPETIARRILAAEAKAREEIAEYRALRAQTSSPALPSAHA